MARLARVVAPGYPHHITQRGNRKQQTFFNDEDYQAYLDLMSKYCSEHEVEIWAYCLMPNHIHMIAVPRTEKGLARAIGEAHRRYTCRINFREEWRGYLWQGRFASCPMDTAHTIAAARYIELNPVRAHLVKDPIKWRWSSARAHLSGEEDPLVNTSKLLSFVNDWEALLSSGMDEAESIIMHLRTGRPLGNEKFIEKLEEILRRRLKPRPPGRKRKRKEK